MTRAAAVLIVFTAAALGEVDLVDGQTLVSRLRTADGRVAVLDTGTEVPTVRLVEARFVAAEEPPGGPINLYLANGDRLRGTVTGGEGGEIALDGPGVAGLRLPLARVRAVCYGRLMGAAQARYAEVFDEERARGRDAVVVQRGARPFVVAARVLGMDDEGLLVRVGDEQRTLAHDKVYGFVRAADPAAGEEAPLSVRVHLVGGTRVTLPLERITETDVLGGGARVARSFVRKIEFAGRHLAHLSDFDPIAEEGRALFGEAPKWRKDAMVLGGPLRLRGTVYERGVGVQAYARVEYVLAGRWTSFFALCGIDDAAGGEGEATFRVLGDGRVLHEVTRRRGQQPARVLLDVRGVDRLALETLPGDSYTSDFCDWAEARVFQEEAR